MRWIAFFYFVGGLFFLASYPTMTIGYFNTISAILSGQTPDARLLLAGAILLMIGVYIAGIGGIIFVILLFRISSDYGIEDASMAITLTILNIIVGWINDTIRIESPSIAYIKAFLTLLSGIVIIGLYYYLFHTFTKMGLIFDNFERHPELLENAVKELKESRTPVRIKDFARKHKLPIELFVKRLKEMISKGELKGSIAKDIFYPEESQPHYEHNIDSSTSRDH